jgi:Domain of unknown function (DUF4291)
MHLPTIPYTQYENLLPQTGKHILGCLLGENIIVYQAFNPTISAYALEHQRFGGEAYSFSRMSWIKPNFLWMMYRSGWASKIGQEHILAIEIPLEKFKMIVAQAVYSSYQADIYPSEENWQATVKASEVRLQWDPDHNPYGTKLNRKAIQLGMKGEILRQFATEWIVSITDITSFVREQGALVQEKQINELLVIQESVVA